MVALAKERGGDDNITVIVAGVSGDLQPVVAGESIGDTLEILQGFDQEMSPAAPQRGRPSKSTSREARKHAR